MVLPASFRWLLYPSALSFFTSSWSVPLAFLTRQSFLSWLSSSILAVSLTSSWSGPLSSWLANILFTFMPFLGYPFTVHVRYTILVHRSHPETPTSLGFSCSVPSVPSDTIKITLFPRRKKTAKINIFSYSRIPLPQQTQKPLITNHLKALVRVIHSHISIMSHNLVSDLAHRT